VRLGLVAIGYFTPGSTTVRELAAIADPGSNETSALVSELNGQREHVRGTLEGLSDESLRRPMVPSGWTCLGLVQHLALDVERFWFCEIVAGQPIETADSDPPKCLDRASRRRCS
jgi:hypothetical protein